MSKLSGLELFAGAGGLAKGLEMAGVQHKALIECNAQACQTLIHNYGHDRVHHLDVRSYGFDQLGAVDIISGGPPCQPFSIGGKHYGNLDRRDMFPYACQAISYCQPKAFIFENVKGILRKSFSNYFEYIILRLTYPEVLLNCLEPWQTQFQILKKLHHSGEYCGVKYNVNFQLFNAASYGIPQCRERVFIVGIREDLNLQWSFPLETHSLDALLWSQFITGHYWEKHDLQSLNDQHLDKRLQAKLKKLRHQSTLFPPCHHPWQTVRDAIGDLPEPEPSDCSNFEHCLREGARSYPGHTGSCLDLPAKTLKAGDHGVPGGENMIRYPDGQVRYLTILEAKRVQTFPDDYQISGSWTEAMRQLGNAVPVQLGYKIAKSLVNQLQAVDVSPLLVLSISRKK